MAGMLSVAGMLLAGCVNDAATFQAEGQDPALTLIRQQPYFWSKRADLALVVARLPECQRRHHLVPSRDGKARSDLYQTEPGHFLFKRGRTWYSIDTGRCSLEKTETPAQQAIGTLLGSFDERSGRLRFVAAEAPVARR